MQHSDRPRRNRPRECRSRRPTSDQPLPTFPVSPCTARLPSDRPSHHRQLNQKPGSDPVWTRLGTWSGLTANFHVTKVSENGADHRMVVCRPARRTGGLIHLVGHPAIQQRYLQLVAKLEGKRQVLAHVIDGKQVILAEVAL